MSRTKRWSLAVLVLVAISLPATLRSQERRNPAGLGRLPATFAGVLPCADCARIRYQITLLPDGAYLQRMTYLLAGHDDSRYQLGRWSLPGDGRTLTLRSGRDAATSWAVLASGTLRRLDRMDRPVDSTQPYELTRRATVEPMEPRATLFGMFRAMADAPRFHDCASGLSWPVAMSDDYRALERAYLEDRTAPGAELMVTIEARIEARPRMEGNGTEATLVVEKFVRATPGESCDEREVTNSLGNTRWRPIRIGDRMLVVAPGQREPWVEMDPRSMRVTGSGGCNRFSGGYQSDQRSLRFGPLVSTRMACLDLDTETAFLRALDRTRHYRIRGRTLDLLDAGGGLAARLEERNLR